MRHRWMIPAIPLAAAFALAAILSPTDPVAINGIAISAKIPRPQAILSISVHWFTKGQRVMDTQQPKTIYDMYGFPEELYQVSYPVQGAPQIAGQTKALMGEDIQIDNSWGIDHGTWSVLCRVYPQADIPVFQLSVDSLASLEKCYETGQKLRSLRNQGVLIFGSGNVVHNLSCVNWEMKEKGYPWAEEFDAYIKDKILRRKDEDVIDYKKAGESSLLAFTYPDHYAPLLYVLGSVDKKERITVFNDACTLGALSMTSYLFG